LIPGANRAAVDGLDDRAAHPDATQAQPEPQIATLVEEQKSFVKGGEPKFRELEPHRRMAEIAPAPASRRVKT
jgi:hypothetical protein